MAMQTILPKTVAEYLADNTYDLSGSTGLKVALLSSSLVLFPAWAASTAYPKYAVRQPTAANGHYYQAQGAGSSAAVEPTWPTDGSSVVDGAVTWLDVGTGVPTEAAEATTWADVSGSEITGTGYVAGGQALSSVAMTADALEAKMTAADSLWSSATFTARYAAVYFDATLNGIVKPILTLLLLDDTPADVAPTGVDFSILWGTNGVFRLPVGCQLI